MKTNIILYISNTWTLSYCSFIPGEKTNSCRIQNSITNTLVNPNHILRIPKIHLVFSFDTITEISQNIESEEYWFVLMCVYNFGYKTELEERYGKQFALQELVNWVIVLLCKLPMPNMVHYTHKGSPNVRFNASCWYVCHVWVWKEEKTVNGWLASSKKECFSLWRSSSFHLLIFLIIFLLKTSAYFLLNLFSAWSIVYMKLEFWRWWWWLLRL